MPRTISRCGCGRRMSRYSHRCKQCENERRERRIAEARSIVATGKCPDCGQDLRQNLALHGWYQCVGYGAEGFRSESATECSFQTFTV